MYGSSKTSQLIFKFLKYFQDKVKLLGRYIEPLSKMIAKIGNEDQEKLGKMKKLMDILSNPTKRMPMETLLKCEAVLERMNLDAPDHMEQKYSATVAATPPPISSSSITPLLEAIVKLKNNKVCVLKCDEPLKITERNHPEIIHYDSTNTVIMFLGFHQLI